MIIRSESPVYGFFATDCSSVGKDYREKYVSAQPFPHIALDNFLDEELVEQCVRDFPTPSKSYTTHNRPQENGKSEFKPECLSPAIRSLFYSFNSAPFIGFLENLTGIKGLIPDPYYLGAGFHQLEHGGRLNVHADFNHYSALNLERRVNVLIYLNKNWKEEYGGNLELWDQMMRSCYARIVPEFNRCVIFNTSSTSFHGNPQPINHPDKLPRRSIALYYYTATWDETRRDHTTLFQVRPQSDDAPVFADRATQVASDFMPPALLRAYRRLVRKLTRRPDIVSADASVR